MIAPTQDFQVIKVQELANYVLTSQQLLYTWAAVEHFPPCQVCWDGESRVVIGTSPVQDYGTGGGGGGYKD